jgi:thiol-disulfide isomerase/thioredoxin
MKTISIGTFLLFIVLQLSAQQNVPVYTFNELEPLLHLKNDTTYVVNFWATWCKPCVKELPAFEKLNEKYTNQKVKVVLVSLDFVKNYDSRLLPFIEENKIQSEVVLLNDPKSNVWIDKVSPLWSGAIPATLIYNSSKRQFFEQSFSFKMLENDVKQFLLSDQSK